ncbi:PAS domain-containing protein [Paenibacillus faecis]|uniref:PAS domain-containing protein n=1 Tax=Paenibacillus faecis TaxID=862114 RepID=A0A5D0CYR3_9BACL|nr:PAS domain-containing protein [Paenibacillus faecis]
MTGVGGNALRDPFFLSQEAANCLPISLAILDPEGTIRYVNQTWIRTAEKYGLSPLWDRPGMNVLKHFGNPANHSGKPDITEWLTRLQRVLDGTLPSFNAEMQLCATSKRWYRLEGVPLRDAETSEIRGLILLYSDITIYKETESKLREAFSQAHILHGLLPICAVCKKIKDELNSWVPIEEYLKARTCADFTHDICPDCIRSHYPQYSRILDSGDP